MFENPGPVLLPCVAGRERRLSAGLLLYQQAEIIYHFPFRRSAVSSLKATYSKQRYHSTKQAEKGSSLHVEHSYQGYDMWVPPLNKAPTALTFIHGFTCGKLTKPIQSPEYW